MNCGIKGITKINFVCRTFFYRTLNVVHKFSLLTKLICTKKYIAIIAALRNVTWRVLTMLILAASERFMRRGKATATILIELYYFYLVACLQTLVITVPSRTITCAIDDRFAVYNRKLTRIDLKNATIFGGLNQVCFEILKLKQKFAGGKLSRLQWKWGL